MEGGDDEVVAEIDPLVSNVSSLGRQVPEIKEKSHFISTFSLTPIPDILEYIQFLLSVSN